MTKLLHSRFWHYDGESPNSIGYDPHKLGLELISTMAYVVENQINIGSPLDGVVVRHHRGDQYEHQVHVAASQQQWDAVKEYLLAID